MIYPQERLYPIGKNLVQYAKKKKINSHFLNWKNFEIDNVEEI